MAFKANSYILSTSYMQIKSAAVGVKNEATSASARMAAESVSASYLFGLIDNLLSQKATMAAVVNTPGLIAYAKDQEDDDTYQVVTEYTAMITQIDVVIAWIVTNFPADGSDFLLKEVFAGDGSRVDRQFNTASTAGLVTALNALIALID